MQIDQNKLNDFVMKFVSELGAVLHAPTVIIGDKLGLYRAMANAGPLSPQALAKKTNTAERYIREWLASQAASGYVSYDPLTGKYCLSPEQAFALADETSPAYIPGAYYIAASLFRDEPQITEAFRTGNGVGWHQHDTDLFCGTEKFFRPGYSANLVSGWLPALDGVVEKLDSGASVADVGCGHGASTILMAQSFPNSHFTGYDYHPPSIEAARTAAARKGLSDRLQFEVASAKTYPGTNFDLVTFFDCLHDMGDPTGAASHVLASLKPDGTWMIVEPFANETVEENLNPVGRIFYSASTMICTPTSLSQEVGAALGAQASDHDLQQVVLAGGFTQFRRAAQAPFNRIFEARP